MCLGKCREEQGWAESGEKAWRDELAPPEEPLLPPDCTQLGATSQLTHCRFCFVFFTRRGKASRTQFPGARQCIFQPLCVQEGQIPGMSTLELPQMRREASPGIDLWVLGGGWGEAGQRVGSGKGRVGAGADTNQPTAQGSLLGSAWTYLFLH